MRLLCKLTKSEEAQRLSAFLFKQGIQNQLEVSNNTDWGSSEYGDIIFRIWIEDEESVEDAKEWLYQFEENPNDPTFTSSLITPAQIQTHEEESPPPKRPETGRITLFFLVTCIVLFIFKALTTPTETQVKPDVPSSGIYSSPVTQELLYDYPETFIILNKLITAYGADSLADPSSLPPDGQLLFKKFEQTPFWIGLYRLLVFNLKSPERVEGYNFPMFEKIKQGEVWRLFSPALLHADIFHILFNMLWLLVLGKQIEQRLGALKYILFTLLIGIISNTCQYLMTGANFLGYSGILCGMFTFIWARQLAAPWEGYQLIRSTIILLSIFIGGMAFLQVASFFSELYANIAFAPTIANTAHLTGALCGWLLGHMKFFAWKSS